MTVSWNPFAPLSNTLVFRLRRTPLFLPPFATEKLFPCYFIKKYSAIKTRSVLLPTAWASPPIPFTSTCATVNPAVYNYRAVAVKACALSLIVIMPTYSSDTRSKQSALSRFRPIKAADCYIVFLKALRHGFCVSKRFFVLLWSYAASCSFCAARYPSATATEPAELPSTITAMDSHACPLPHTPASE